MNTASLLPNPFTNLGGSVPAEVPATRKSRPVKPYRLRLLQADAEIDALEAGRKFSILSTRHRG